MNVFGRGRGRGKVILLAEHAVVYGHPALAASLALGVRATATRGERNRVRVSEWGVDTDRDPGGGVARAFAAVREALGVGGAWDVVCEATVPPRAGVGSSAAMAVAVARALAHAAGVDGAAAIESAADAAERVFHGNPSGIDVALAARGGIGLYRRGAGLTPLAVPPFRLALGLTGEPRDTAARVADVARRRERDREDTDRRLAELGALALAGARALERSEPPGEALSPLFAAAQAELSALGLSSPGIDRLCAIAAEVGSSAKLTGAGGGGAVIAAARVDDVAAAWRAAGFEAHVVDVGGDA